jgi:hypothetical protein
VKITLGEMREMGLGGILVADYRCSHSVALSADRWPDDLWLSDIEPGFCNSSGKRGAEVQISKAASLRNLRSRSEPRPQPSQKLEPCYH